MDVDDVVVDDDVDDVVIVQKVQRLSPLEAILATAGPVELATVDPQNALEAIRDTQNGGVGGRVGVRGKKAQAALLALQGANPIEISEAIGIPAKKIEKFLASPMAQSLLAKVEEMILGKLQRGEYGPIPMAKHAAEHMMSQIIAIAMKGRNENTKRQAAMDVLGLAGHVAIKKAEIFNVNELIDSMDADELNKFIVDGSWPDRLRDRAALLSMSNKNNMNKKMRDVTPKRIGEKRVPA